MVVIYLDLIAPCQNYFYGFEIYGKALGLLQLSQLLILSSRAEMCLKSICEDPHFGPFSIITNVSGS